MPIIKVRLMCGTCCQAIETELTEPYPQPDGTVMVGANLITKDEHEARRWIQIQYEEPSAKLMSRLRQSAARRNLAPDAAAQPNLGGQELSAVTPANKTGQDEAGKIVNVAPLKA